MPDTTRIGAWRVSGGSVQGASHKRSGLPNQDSLLTWTPGGAGPPAIVAVADGHGGSRHFRSATGSAFAVEAARVALHTTLPLLAEGKGPAQAEQIDSIIRRLMVAEWRAMVASHLAAHPCTEDELFRLSAGDGEDAAARVAQHPILAYGSTVLAGLLAHDTLVLVQLGDGDIVCVQADGTPTRGFERDERHVGSVTTSLCQANAEDEVRVRVIPLSEGGAPVLVCLSSDGYSNSFRTEEDFIRVGSDVLAHIESRGLGPLTADLPTFLADASSRGSGDDITLAILTCAVDGTADVGLAAGDAGGGGKREAAGVLSTSPVPQNHGRAQQMAAVPLDVPPAAGPALVTAPRSVGRSPIVIGLTVFIIVVAAALLAASIPCARIPLMRPICEVRGPPKEESVRTDSAPVRVPEKSAGQKTKGAGKGAPTGGKKGNNPR